MEEFFKQNPFLFVIVLLWVFIWKGIALWRAARLNHKNWFVALLILNTMAILDIFYIYFFSRRTNRDKGDNKEVKQLETRS